MIKNYRAFLLISFFYTFMPLANAAPSSPLSICIDFHCDKLIDVSITEYQWKYITSLFSVPSQNSDNEREKIRTAIAYFETEIGKVAGTWRDKGTNALNGSNKLDEDGLNTQSKEEGQVDCIAESLNTTTYLNLLADKGLLKWHIVSERRQRHRLFVAPHWTAVIKERNSGIKYAVDSWFLDNGYPPYIQELKLWAARKPFKTNN